MKSSCARGDVGRANPGKARRGHLRLSLDAKLETFLQLGGSGPEADGAGKLGPQAAVAVGFEQQRDVVTSADGAALEVPIAERAPVGRTALICRGRFLARHPSTAGGSRGRR